LNQFERPVVDQRAKQSRRVGVSKWIVSQSRHDLSRAFTRHVRVESLESFSRKRQRFAAPLAHWEVGFSTLAQPDAVQVPLLLGSGERGKDQYRRA
jgi:hypothetical protein